MYTNQEILKGFQLWYLSNFTAIPTLKQIQEITDEKLQDFLTAHQIYEYTNKKGG